MRRSLVSLAALGVLSSSSVFAHQNGQTGFSGKVSANSCDSCHTGGTDPTVTITGPETLLLNATGLYKVTITGGAGVTGGFNAAVSMGTMSLKAGTSDVKVESGEVTHTNDKAFSAGAVSFEFNVKAPATGTTFKIFTRGVSSNNNASPVGDNGNSAELNVALTSPPVADAGTPDAGTPDAGTPDAGTPGADSGTPNPPATPNPGGDDDGTDLPDEPSGGCSMAGGFLAPLGMLLGALALRRKRTPS